jgi:hypothetical protein
MICPRKKIEINEEDCSGCIFVRMDFRKKQIQKLLNFRRVKEFKKYVY